MSNRFDGLVMIEGAMDIELDYLISRLEHVSKKEIAGYLFYQGNIENVQLVLCKTQMGILNATIATMTGISEFHPSIVISQGTAGGHTDWIHTNDIVLCKTASYLNAYRMPLKGVGEGSDSLQWTLDTQIPKRMADKELIQMFQTHPCPSTNTYAGCIGSGDIYSREADRITWFHEHCDNLCEDMETYGVYEVCERLAVPCVGIRIISNNELLGEAFDKQTAYNLQQYVLDTLLKEQQNERTRGDV